MSYIDGRQREKKNPSLTYFCFCLKCINMFKDKLDNSLKQLLFQSFEIQR